MITIKDFLKKFQGLPEDTPIVADTNEGEVFLSVTGVSVIPADSSGNNNEDGTPTPIMICVDVIESSLDKVFLQTKYDEK